MSSSALPAFNSTFLRPVLISIFSLVSMVLVCAQAPEPSPSATPAKVESTPSAANPSTDVQGRIQRARALAAAHQLQTAANELEDVRRLAQDDVVRNITSVMLMGIYLEEGNYVRAQVLLDEDFRARASGRDAALRTYFAIAGQAINGARSHLARYRGFGINVSDPDLPAEANTDLDRLRGLLERLTAQAKEIVAERKAYDSLALLEDVVGVRLSIARDAADRAAWEAEYAGAREGLASSQTQIASLTVPALTGAQVPATAAATKEPPPATKEPPTSTAAPTTQSMDATSSAAVPSATPGEPTENKKDGETPTVSTGSLNARASKTVVPTYPQLAKTAGITGLVRVYVLVDESGKVAQITSSEGPILLRANSEEAARAWRFPPTAISGKPVKLSGFIEFSFTR